MVALKLCVIAAVIVNLALALVVQHQEGVKVSDEKLSNLSEASVVRDIARRGDEAEISVTSHDERNNLTKANVTELLLEPTIGEANKLPIAVPSTGDTKPDTPSRPPHREQSSRSPLDDAQAIQHELDTLSIELGARLNDIHSQSQIHRRELQARRDHQLQGVKHFWGKAMRRLRHYMLYVMPFEQQEAIASRGAEAHYHADDDEQLVLQPLEDDAILHEFLSSVMCYKVRRDHALPMKGDPDSHADGDDVVYNITLLFENGGDKYPFAIRRMNKIVPVSISTRHQGGYDNHRSLGHGTTLDLNVDYLFAAQSSRGRLLPVPGSFFSLFLSDASLVRDAQWVLFQTKLHAFVRDVCIELMHNPIDLFDRGVMEEEEEARRANEEEEQLRQLIADL